MALEEAIRKVTGDAQVRPGRVKLDLPPLIENGNSVLLDVSVESPMTAADHVKAIHVFTREEPAAQRDQRLPRAARRPRALSTRARIADTGTGARSRR